MMRNCHILLIMISRRRGKKEVNDQQSYLPNRMETLRFPFSRFNIVCISNFREKENSESRLHHRDQVLSISREILFAIKLTRRVFSHIFYDDKILTARSCILSIDKLQICHFILHHHTYVYIYSINWKRNDPIRRWSYREMCIRVYMMRTRDKIHLFFVFFRLLLRFFLLRKYMSND